MNPEFELRHLTYFSNGNVFVGSSGALRYRLAPNPKDKVMMVHAWKNEFCFERQENPPGIEVPLSDEGLEQAVAWLQAESQKESE